MPRSQSTPPILCHLCSKLVTAKTSHPYFFRCHAKCVERTNARLMKRWAKKHAYDTQHEPGYACRYGPADIQVIAPATIEEYEVLRAERDAARQTPRTGQGADPALATLLVGVA